MEQMSISTRQKVVALSNAGLGPSAIRRRLAQDSIQVSRQGIAAFLRHYKNTGSVGRKQCRCGYGKVADHLDIVHNLYKENDELSAVDVQKIMREHGIAVHHQAMPTEPWVEEVPTKVLSVRQSCQPRKEA